MGACNGLAGDVDGYECFPVGDGFFSYRFWYAARPVFAGPGRSAWRFVELSLRMNSIEQGVGLVDGAIRYAVDGELLIAHDRILLRTGAHPTMRFNQIFLAPGYAVAGERLWIDDLTVARGP